MTIYYFQSVTFLHIEILPLDTHLLAFLSSHPQCSIFWQFCICTNHGTPSQQHSKSLQKNKVKNSGECVTHLFITYKRATVYTKENFVERKEEKL